MIDCIEIRPKIIFGDEQSTATAKLRLNVLDRVLRRYILPIGIGPSAQKRQVLLQNDFEQHLGHGTISDLVDAHVAGAAGCFRNDILDGVSRLVRTVSKPQSDAMGDSSRPGPCQVGIESLIQAPRRRPCQPQALSGSNGPIPPPLALFREQAPIRLMSKDETVRFPQYLVGYAHAHTPIINDFWPRQAEARKPSFRRFRKGKIAVMQARG